MMNHATFKASLFMSVGIIDHETGTRDMRRLGGLSRSMPITATLAIVACAAMAGVPLLNGFLSKEMFFAETVFVSATPAVEFGLPALATLAGVFAVVYSLRFAHDVFFGAPGDCPRPPHEPVHWMRVPVELLVLACVLVGTLPAWTVGALLATAAQPVVGGVLPEYSLAVWHGFNAPLIMSLIATAGGALLYLRFASNFKQRTQRSAPGLRGLDGKRVFEGLLALATDLSRRLARALGTRRLQPQLLCLVLIAGLAGLASALIVPLSWGDRARVPATPAFALLWFIGAVCAIGAAWQARFHRLAALTMLGAVGLVLCISFAWFSAPDLALTQLAVEVVTLVLFLLGLRWMPKRAEPEHPQIAPRARWRRRRDLGVALLIGAGLAALSFALQTRQAPLSISPYFLEYALPVGGGSNVVNVMLVDVRAFDTLGEISVLGIVGITVYALLRRFRPPRETLQVPEQQRLAPDVAGRDLVDRTFDTDRLQEYLEVPAVLVRLLLPVAALFAFHLFMRGHNLPGGGFVAGLVMAIAFIAQYMVGGTRWVEARMRLKPPRWIGFGLLAALLTGLGSLAFGYPFLTTHTAHVHWPLIGEVHLPTAALFDLGVFAVVVGSTLLMLTAIAHQSLRAQRRDDAEAEAG
jgi:multicomponent K+:H+ antiporter subunit A